MAQRPGGQLGGKRDGSSALRSTDRTPQSKRRRVDKPAPDESGDWDDEFDLTQQDLENLDVIASQAIEGGIAGGEASTSRQGGQGSIEHTLELGSASLSRSTQAGHDESGVFQAPTPGVTLRLKNRSSTSSNSDSSVYPQSSASFNSIFSRHTPSSDVSSAAGSLTSSSARSSGGQSSGEVAGRPVAGPSRQNGAASSIVTITTLREDLRKKEIEASWKDAEEQRQKEREKELKQEVEKLQTQAQFKTQDFLQLQQRCRTLENKLTHQQTASPSEPQPSTSTGGATSSQTAARSPDKSPKLRRVELRGSRTPEKGAFPSVQSFMSPHQGVQAGGAAAQSVATMTEGWEVASPDDRCGERRRLRRFRLNVQCVRGSLSGPQLVSHLLHCSCSKSGEVEDCGIVGLLQTMPSRQDLTGLKYERDSATARLSPVKKKARRLSSPGTHSAAKQPHTTSHKAIVEREHFLRAVQGLRQLIDSPAPQLPPPSTKPNRLGGPSISGPSISGPSISGPSISGPSSSGASIPARGAVLLLPMLNDYLQHYIDILSSSSNEATAPTSPNVGSGSNKSSSCETGSSLESLTSSLEVLLQQGAEYANTVETLTLCALRVLNMLVSACEDVRSLVVMSRTGLAAAAIATDTSSSTVETDQEKDNPNESGMEGDDERSTVSSKGSGSSFLISPTGSLTSPAVKLEGLNLLHKLVRLASPSQESSGFKVPVVEAALDVLHSLIVNLPSADVERLHIIVLRGVFTECLQLENQPGVAMRALDLFSSLARSRSILPFLCTKDGSCTLLNIHLVLTRLLSTSQGKQELQPLLLHIITKIIPSLVHSMFYLLRDYQLSHSEDVFGILRKGVLLLHEISLRDPNYQQRHGAVDLYYSTLMSSLTRIYRHRHHDIPQTEVSALEDLWEELDESDTCSQDSDREEPMVTDS
ncbi:hypothetical protein ACOMHN_034261 [Nucella lapillus]